MKTQRRQYMTALHSTVCHRGIGTGISEASKRVPFFPMLPGEANKKVPIFDKGTESQPSGLGQAQIRLPAGRLEFGSVE